jgi:hypothetical protein
MFTPEIVFLMITNTLAATASSLVALQAFALESGLRLGKVLKSVEARRSGQIETASEPSADEEIFLKRASVG